MRKCLNCNKKTNNPKFCSLSCSSKYAASIKRKNKLPRFKECKQCGNLFQFEDKRKQFCNSSCAASYNNLGKTKNKPTNPRTIKGIETTHCLNCNKELVGKSKRYSTTCNKKCSGEYIRKRTIQKWKDNPDSATHRDGNLSSAIRLHLIEEAGNKCSCGFNTINKFTGKVPLTINHIDGNSRNNKPDNLEVLCYRCHSLTENFGALNKGKSNRLDRRHKYRQTQMIEHGEYKFYE